MKKEIKRTYNSNTTLPKGYCSSDYFKKPQKDVSFKVELRRTKHKIQSNLVKNEVGVKKEGSSISICFSNHDDLKPIRRRNEDIDVSFSEILRETN